ncbi:MAG: hypothetical protein ACRD4C_08645 [Candidatus Acidiferrales bacterium]
MRDTIQAGAILIKEGTCLPETLRIETKSCVPGWNLVENCDGYGLDRKIRKEGWTFFCSAGDIRATAVGADAQALVRRAVEKILANPKAQKFNALEITRVVSKRFLGAAYANVFARSRHIQESLFLFQGPNKAKHDSLTQIKKLAGDGKTLPSGSPPNGTGVKDHPDYVTA